MVVRNEFATVLLEPEGEADQSVVRITDLRTGRQVSLDPLELEALTRLSRDDLTILVDPSFPGLAGDRRFELREELVPGEGEMWDPGQERART